MFYVFEYDSEIVVNTINNDISLLEIFSSFHSFVVWDRWLVNTPVVEWRIVYWVLNHQVADRFWFLSKFNLIRTNHNTSNSKISRSHLIVQIHHRFWIYKNRYSMNLKSNFIIKDWASLQGNGLNSVKKKGESNEFHFI